MSEQSSHIPGAVRLTLHLDQLHGIDVADPIGRGEWELRVWVNGIERWRTEKRISIGKGEAVPIGAAIVSEVPEHADRVVVEVRGTERDLFNPDEHAAGSITLHRSLGFDDPDAGTRIPIRGEGHLVLDCHVEVEPITAAPSAG